MKSVEGRVAVVTGANSGMGLGTVRRAVQQRGVGLGPYNVAKHGVVALMATLERELRSAKSPVRTSVHEPVTAAATTRSIRRNTT